MSVEGFKAVAGFVSGFTEDGIGMFKRARENARMAGKILGTLLASRYPFET